MSPASGPLVFLPSESIGSRCVPVRYSVRKAGHCGHTHYYVWDISLLCFTHIPYYFLDIFPTTSGTYPLFCTLARGSTISVTYLTYRKHSEIAFNFCCATSRSCSIPPPSLSRDQITTTDLCIGIYSGVNEY